MRALALIAILFGPGTVTAQVGPAVPDALPDEIPIFPLGDVTLFPNSTRPFHIFEPRYRQMLSDALAGDGVIGMVMLEPGFEADYQGNPPVTAIGCAGLIVASERLPDGRYDIALRGFTKFRIIGEDQSGPYRVARVEEIVEEPVADTTLLANRRRQLEEALLAAIPGAELPPASLSDAELIDGLSIILPMDPARRQELLEADGPLERAALLIGMLRGGVSAQ